MKPFIKIFALLLTFLIIGFILFGLLPKYRYKYFYSPDRRNVLTRVFDGNKVYYVYGYYNKRTKPNSYIQPKSVCGFDEGYNCIINWTDSICTIYKCYGIYYENGLPENLCLKEINCYEDNLWVTMLSDTINNIYDTGPSCKIFN